MKKVIMSLVILLICIVGINNVQAEEGKNKLGSSVQYCEYCRKNSDKCVYVILDTKNNKTNNNLTKIVNIYKGKINSSSKLELTEKLSDCRSTFYKITGIGTQECTLVETTNLPKTGEKFTSCSNYLYYYAIEDHVTIFGNVLFNFYYMSNEADGRSHAEQTARNWQADADSDWTKIGNKFEAKDDIEYILNASYGIDDLRIDSPNLQDRVKEIADAESKIREEERQKSQDQIDRSGHGCAVLTEPIIEKMNWALDAIKYGGAALAILLGAFDFMKAVLSDEDNATKKAAGNFVKRLIAAVLIFLLPLLIQFILTTVEIEGLNVDAPTCGVGISE